MQQNQDTESNFTDRHSPTFQTQESTSELDKDWVKATEEHIELLQNKTSAVLQSMFFYSNFHQVFLHIFQINMLEFAESYEALWEQFCEKITELNEQSVTSIAQTVSEAARLEDEGKLLQDELLHAQTVTSSFASKLLPEQ